MPKKAYGISRMIFRKEDLYIQTYLDEIEKDRKKRKKPIAKFVIDDEFRTILIGKRISKKMSQKTLAHLLKTNQSFISRVENGKTIPSTRSLMKIAQALNCKLTLKLENL